MTDEDAAELETIARDLLEWSIAMGGFENPAWIALKYKLDVLSYLDENGLVRCTRCNEHPEERESLVWVLVPNRSVAYDYDLAPFHEECLSGVYHVRPNEHGNA